LLQGVPLLVEGLLSKFFFLELHISEARTLTGLGVENQVGVFHIAKL
jgi:hypothetical protein